MIPHGVEVYIGLEPIDLRWSFDRLAGAVKERIGREAKCGALFVFMGRRRDALKVFFCDARGMCIFYKRLYKGTFRLPEALSSDATAIAIDERTLDDLLDGIDVDARSAPRRPRTRLH